MRNKKLSAVKPMKTYESTKVIRGSQSVADLSMNSSVDLKNGSTVMLPPLNPNSSALLIDVSKISKNGSKDERFKEPTSVRKLKEQIPIAYLQNLDTFSQSINKSTSNLTKDLRF